ncbi:MAG: ATP-binding protein [Gemmatimonadetes bacterium]|nr:ATP-binding protein [Gemmatimonadota bacterium]
MIQDLEGIKRDVAEVKFLIHDLRVESFINEVIHYHVTVNTDLEVYNASQAQAIHAEDVQELRTRALIQRQQLQEYSNAVKSFSPDRTILELGRNYIDTVHDICGLILDPRWGRSHKVLSFLPPDSRSVRSHAHYMNCIRWICNVHARIQHFRDEQSGQEFSQPFDLATEVRDFVRHAIRGYVAEKSHARVEIQVDRMDPAVLQGNLYRFRRMFFNLVMNAVDAMKERKVGILNISAAIAGDRVVLRVRDNGAGMPAAKIQQLLTDRESLDGELHSLGFVFVRKSVAEFRGELSIESEVGRGTTITISLPYIRGATAAPNRLLECEKLEILRDFETVRSSGKAAWAKQAAASPEGRLASCGEVVFADYRISDAQFPGSIFAMGVNDEGRIDFFTHRPYEREWDITHEDLSPMLFEATVRGRLEEDEDRVPVLILKAPLSAREFFDFRAVPEADRSADRFVALVHDEYIRVARRLIDTGLPADIGVLVTDLQKFFRESSELLEAEPFVLDLLAKQRLTSEQDSP